MRVGIISAIQEENCLLSDQFLNSKKYLRGKREYIAGTFLGHEAFLTFSGWGKVAAAISASYLIVHFGVEAIIFIGVAGSCTENVRIGDIVIANNLVQHDMDARPFYLQHEIPLIGLTSFKTEEQWTKRARQASYDFLQKNFSSMNKEHLDIFGISSPKIHEGTIASGDKFFTSQRDYLDLKKRLPETLCVEMEGAAVAQVCYEYHLPYCVIRIISDKGDHESAVDFQKFISSIADLYSLGILQEIFLRI